MKQSVLLIGMGKFGSYLCRRLYEQGCEIMVVDTNEEQLSGLLRYVVSTKIGDCRRKEVLENFGIDAFDHCVVCIGEDFQSSLEITDNLHELGAKHIISRACTDTQAKFLLKNGAHEVVYPERDLAERLAISIGIDGVLDYFKLSQKGSIYEIAPPAAWVGRNLRELDVRKRFNVNIVAINRVDGDISMPTPDYVFTRDEKALAFASHDDILKVFK